jgi:hypothetical protein
MISTINSEKKRKGKGAIDSVTGDQAADDRPSGVSGPSENRGVTDENRSVSVSIETVKHGSWCRVAR